MFGRLTDSESQHQLIRDLDDLPGPSALSPEMARAVAWLIVGASFALLLVRLWP